MRILITGGSGFVGRHLADLLRRQGHDVLSWGLAAAPDVVAVDLCDANAVAARDLTGFGAVVHLAGLAQVGPSFAEPIRYVCENSAMEVNLFEALLAQRTFPRVLIASSGAVYGTGSDVITEDTPVEPTSPYAVSKLTQELFGRYYGRLGFEVVIARPFNHVGPGQRRGFLVADIASQIAMIERDGRGVLEVGDLSSARDYSDVRDIVAAYAQILQSGRSGEVYNVCSGRSHRGEEIVERLVKMATDEIRLVRSPSLERPLDSSAVIASNEKLQRDTSWYPRFDLETTLRDTLAYWRSMTRG